MFESADTGHRISKEAYKQEEPLLRQALLEAQYRLLDAGRFPVIIVVGGVDGAGKGETVNLFNEWMDPRHIITCGFGAPSSEEAERPRMWRFWQALPPKGRIGMLFGSWYTEPIVDRVSGKSSDKELQKAIADIRDFEDMLSTEGTLLVKFWFHLSEDAQKARLEELESDAKTRWRVTATDWERFKQYKTFRKVSEAAVTASNTEAAPWHVIDGSCAYYRSLTAGRLLLQALTQRLEAPAAAAAAALPALPASPPALAGLDYSLRMKRKEYEHDLEVWQGRLNLLTREKGFAKKSLVLVFEGQDAAGKGGAIRRITAALDARQYQVIPVAAPNDEERAQPWLWRFWRRLPRKGHITLFDRSWYGRVLVERVEKFASEADWRRAYHEINQFEEELTDNDTILVKFWLAITKEEQLKRFREREDVAFKNHKITPEDWRNREQWDAYEAAVNDMVAQTDRQQARWTLVPSDDVEYARIHVLKTICHAIEAALDKKPGKKD